MGKSGLGIWLEILCLYEISGKRTGPHIHIQPSNNRINSPWDERKKKKLKLRKKYEKWIIFKRSFKHCGKEFLGLFLFYLRLWLILPTQSHKMTDLIIANSFTETWDNENPWKLSEVYTKVSPSFPKDIWSQWGRSGKGDRHNEVHQRQVVKHKTVAISKHVKC